MSARSAINSGLFLCVFITFRGYFARLNYVRTCPSDFEWERRSSITKCPKSHSYHCLSTLTRGMVEGCLQPVQVSAGMVKVHYIDLYSNKDAFVHLNYFVSNFVPHIITNIMHDISFCNCIFAVHSNTVCAMSLITLYT